MARRLLEAFLGFRYPSLSGELFKQMDEVRFDAAKKAKLLRFTHTYSHDSQIPEAEHDLTLLAETPQTLRDLMDLIAAEDPRHFEEMQKLVAPATEDAPAAAPAAAIPAVVAKS